MNEQHQHAWDFIDAPLAYQAFLGGQYGNDGVQLKWVAPTDQFVEFGAEVGQRRRAFPAPSATGTAPAVGVVYAHTGGDIGESHSWRAGLSYLQTHAQDREYAQTDLAGNDAQLGFNGTSHVAIADFVWKYAPNGNAQYTNFKLQGEYFWRRERGDLTYDRDGALGLTRHVRYSVARRAAGTCRASTSSCRTGASACATTGSIPDTPNYGANAAFLATPSFNPQRTSVMFDYTPSEFSRIRLQLAQERDAPGRDRQPVLPAIHPDPGRARRAHVTEEQAMKSICAIVAAHADRGVGRSAPRGAQRVRDGPRMGRARRRAGRRQGQGLHRHQRAAGPASRRGEAEPDRAGARRGPRRRDRRRARNRLAAAGAAAGRQSEGPAGQARLFRGRAVRARCSTSRRASIAPRATCTRQAIRTSRPTRATSRALPDRCRRGSPQLDPANAAYYQARYKAFADRWSAAIARWEKDAAPLKGVAVLVQHKAFTYLIAWLGLKEVAALEPKPGDRADDRASVRGAGD